MKMVRSAHRSQTMYRCESSEVGTEEAKNRGEQNRVESRRNQQS
jgi:hypothetical protein